MRFQVTCELSQKIALPVNHQYHLCGQVYDLLRQSDPQFACTLHDDGYRASVQDARRYKLFCFSTLRAPKTRRQVIGETLILLPGLVQWQVSSPCATFMKHLATGLMSAGSLRVGEATLPLREVQTCYTPDFGSGMAHLTCLTPIVASVYGEAGSRRFLRSSDGIAFSEAVKRNLLHKYAALNNCGFNTSTPFALTWDADYLAHSSRAGQKKIRFKDFDIIGVQAPCTMTGDPSLLSFAYDSGLGERNASGCGMVAIEISERVCERK